jgi:hypothetical protein
LKISGPALGGRRAGATKDALKREGVERERGGGNEAPLHIKSPTVEVHVKMVATKRNKISIEAKNMACDGKS